MEIIKKMEGKLSVKEKGQEIPGIVGNGSADEGFELTSDASFGDATNSVDDGNQSKFTVTCYNDKVSLVATDDKSTRYDGKSGMFPCDLHPFCEGMIKKGNLMGKFKIISPENHPNFNQTDNWGCWLHVAASMEGRESHEPKNSRKGKKSK